jgi:general secretion pathway protein C
MAQGLFGVQSGAVTAAPSNLVVTGILAAGRLGSALIAVDGKPARAYHVGEELSPGQKLVAVRGNSVFLETAAGRAELAGPPQASLAILNSAPARDPAAPSGISPAPAPAR